MAVTSVLFLARSKAAGRCPGWNCWGPRGVICLTHENDSPFIHTLIGLSSGSVERLTPCPCDTPAELVTERLRRGCKTKRYFTLLRTVRALLGEFEN